MHLCIHSPFCQWSIELLFLPLPDIWTTAFLSFQIFFYYYIYSIKFLWHWFQNLALSIYIELWSCLFNNETGVKRAFFQSSACLRSAPFNITGPCSMEKFTLKYINQVFSCVLIWYNSCCVIRFFFCEWQFAVSVIFVVLYIEMEYNVTFNFLLLILYTFYVINYYFTMIKF